jgi:hypothetical protein
MNLSTRKSAIHHHLTSSASKKQNGLRDKDADKNAVKVESGFGKLQFGSDELSVKAAYKPIFRF